MRLHRATRIRLPRNRIANASTRLIHTDAIREIVVKRPQLVCAVITHPSTPCARCDTKLDTAVRVDRRDPYLRVILMCRAHGGRENPQERKDDFQHDRIVEFSHNAV
jgi:hypothetical protein